MDLPGPGTVFLNQSWDFVAPVYIGDSITGEVVLKGEAWFYTFAPGP